MNPPISHRTAPGMEFQSLGAPDYEFTRSPAALRVGRAALRNGLRLSHFEHRLALELPEEWIPESRPDLGHLPAWRAGVLAESKYLSFRHDRLIGSFHPGHRSKWTTHELCHGLVGYAWSRTFTRFDHAVAARLAEVLPVALYYFFDEAGLRRCEQHHEGGPLHALHCSDCEVAARSGPTSTSRDGDWWAQGRQFVERELRAVELSYQRGRIVPNRLGSLELGSDGLAYATAHGPRLESDAFAMFVERFAPVGAGRLDTISDLAIRTRQLVDELEGGEIAPDWAAPTGLWIAQDIGFRLLTLWTETAEGPDEDLLSIIDDLASRPDDIDACIAAYRSLAEAVELPAVDEVFSVGYPLPGRLGSSLAQIADGVRSALPVTSAQMADFDDRIRAFAADDPRVREPIATRFYSWFSRRSEEWSDVARYEAALVTARSPDAEALSLTAHCELASSTVLSLAPHVALLEFDRDVPAIVESFYSDESELPSPHPICVCIYRLVDGEVAVLPVAGPALTMLRALKSGPIEASHLDPNVLDALLAHVLAVPSRYILSRDATPE